MYRKSMIENVRHRVDSDTVYLTVTYHRHMTPNSGDGCVSRPDVHADRLYTALTAVQ